jgi:hypothetical protein
MVATAVQSPEEMSSAAGRRLPEPEPLPSARSVVIPTSVVGPSFETSTSSLLLVVVQSSLEDGSLEVKSEE